MAGRTALSHSQLLGRDQLCLENDVLEGVLTCLAMSELEAQSVLSGPVFFSKMAYKLPKLVKHHCRRIFRPDTGNLEEKPQSSRKGRKFWQFSLHASSCLAGPSAPPPLNLHSAQVFLPVS